jgi:phosphate-selective porin OprO/OprP
MRLRHPQQMLFRLAMLVAGGVLLLLLSKSDVFGQPAPPPALTWPTRASVTPLESRPVVALFAAPPRPIETIPSGHVAPSSVVGGRRSSSCDFVATPPFDRWSPPTDRKHLISHASAESSEHEMTESSVVESTVETRVHGNEISEWLESDGEKKLVAEFEDGVALVTEDGEFELKIRLMLQTDFKYFLPHDQEPARPGVYIPRFRTYFEGHITPSFQYELSLQRSVEGAFDLLDANINFRPKDELQIRIGRFLVPYSYDWYDHLEQFSITPERGLFPLNFGLSREAGAMIWGELFENQLEYAVGAFSGQLAGLADTNETRDAVAYINTRPTRHLNVGGSLALGNQVFPGEALPLRTSIQSSENDEAAQAASSVFLEYEEGVELLGARRQGALHLAWYGGPFSLESEFQVGEFRFRTPEGAPRLPVRGYHMTTSCFLTGETIINRSLVVPLAPFNPAEGDWGPGAIEAFFRFSHLTLGEEVFTEDLADPDDWTRSLSTVDLGWNWYPNRYVKFYFDWQMSIYDTPVLIDRETGETTSQSHLFWLRAQIFF